MAGTKNHELPIAQRSARFSAVEDQTGSDPLRNIYEIRICREKKDE